MDVTGKIVVVIFDAPKAFPSSERAHHSSPVTKKKTAVAHGAVGILGIASPALEKMYPWAAISEDLRRDIFWLDQQGSPANAFRELRLNASLSVAGAQKVFGARAAADIFAREAATQPFESR